MHLEFYRRVGLRMTSRGRWALVLEFLLPAGGEATMTDLGRLAQQALAAVNERDALRAENAQLKAQLAALPPAPAIAGDADDSAELDKLAAALDPPTAQAAGAAAAP